MSVELKELLEERNALVVEVQRQAKLANDPTFNWDDAAEEGYEKLNKDLSEADRRVKYKERELEMESRLGGYNSAIEVETLPREWVQKEEAALEKRAVNLGTPGGKRRITEADAEDIDHAVAGWLKAHSSNPNLDERHRVACRRLGFNPMATEIEIPLISPIGMEHRLNKTATTGGEFVPEGFAGEVERTRKAFGGATEWARVITTPTGNDLPWPTVDDVTNVGQIEGEGDAVAEQDVTTGEVVLGAYKISSDLVKVSSELLQDSAFDIGTLLGSILGERIGRHENALFTTGTGTAQPKGVMNAPIAAWTQTSVATGATINYNNLVDTVHKVDPLYRRNPGVAWMMHDAIVAAVRKLTDDQSNPLWEPSMQVGNPDRLLGYPIVINQDMDGTLAVNDYPAVFGDGSRFVIRRVAGIRLRVLTERYADTDQVGFIAFTRVDSDRIESSANSVPYAFYRVAAT